MSVACLLGVLLTAGSACSGGVPLGGQEPESTADCSDAVRVGERVYVGYAFTQRAASRHGTAERADCHDVGEDAPGNVFPEDPQTVVVFAFEGYSPDRVLGIRAGGGLFEVMVARSLSRDEVERVTQELTAEGG